MHERSNREKGRKIQRPRRLSADGGAVGEPKHAADTAAIACTDHVADARSQRGANSGAIDEPLDAPYAASIAAAQSSANEGADAASDETTDELSNETTDTAPNETTDTAPNAVADARAFGRPVLEPDAGADGLSFDAHLQPDEAP